MSDTTFQEIKILDNFYQTSSFFPMPTIAISSTSESGQTNIGAYSLCFPYYIAGKDYYTMILMTRNNSNTAKNIIRTKKCALNFISDDSKHLTQIVKLGFPGDTTDEKMKDCIFKLISRNKYTDSASKPSADPQIEQNGRPEIISDAFQVFECTWLDHLENADKFKVQEEYHPPYNDFNGITSKFGAHFILRIDKILLKEKFKASIIEGVKNKSFPKIPIDYGYRDNTNFWISKFKKPIAEPIPKSRGLPLETIIYAVERLHTEVNFTNEACKSLSKVPRVFLNKALKGCVEWAEKNNVDLITIEHMAKIRDKRNTEKLKK